MDRATGTDASIIEEYLQLGLALGRHNAGIVDAYYGPSEFAEAASSAPMVAADVLAHRFGELAARIARGEGDLAAQRRTWMLAQVSGLQMVSRVLSGESVSYLDEVEACYGVRPEPVQQDEIAEAHRGLDRALPGSGPLRERVLAARDRHIVPAERVPEVIETISDYLREQTRSRFGLPEGESVEFLLESDKPYSGFNYYDGNLQSRVAINTDLPLSSTAVAHLVAHEAYPGHHTEHCLKEVGLVRKQKHLEETIFLIGTPSCLMAEGLADLALEAVLGDGAARIVEPMMTAMGVHYDLEVIEAMSQFAELSSRMRGTMAIDLHDRGVPVDEVIETAQRHMLVDRARAEKSVQFLTDPTWRAYVFCYSEGLRLCRGYAGGSPERFMSLLTEQLTPADLTA